MLSPVEAESLLRLTQHALDDSNDFSAHHLRLFLPESSNNGDHYTSQNRPSAGPAGDSTALTVRLTASQDSSYPSASLNLHTSDLEVLYSSSMIPTSSSSSSLLGSFIASQLRDVFSEEEAILAHLLSSHSLHSGKKSLSPEVEARLDKRTTRSLKYAPLYHLTISLFTPEASPSSWDIQDAVRSTFGPLIEALSPISNLTIDTQIQPYASFAPSVQPTFSKEQNVWTLSRTQLGGFINAAEWPLSPSIGGGPTVHFVLYVPSPSQAPLLVDGSEGSNAWLIPQWGGVVIHNAATSSRHLSAEDLRVPFLTFSQQLLSLLGLPEHPASLPIRLDTLARVRAASLFLSASSTLGSLARLTLALPSISIPNSVADAVSLTIKHLETSCSAFKNGDFASALQSARIAEGAAERAFFERSMVGQVYFPDEHKVAVYLPLLGPVAVPLVLSAIKELRPIVSSLLGRLTGK